MDKETIAHVESPQVSVPPPHFFASLIILTRARSNDGHSAEEKGHLEDVNLQNNISAKYVLSPSLLVLKTSFTWQFLGSI